MLENYYKKYNILRDSRTQERVLGKELENIRRLYIMWEGQKERFLQLIDEIRANPDLSDEEKEAQILRRQQTIDRNDDIYLDLQQKEAVIVDALTSDEDRVDDGTTRDDRITTAYMRVIFYERAISSISRLEKDAISKKDPVEQQEMLEQAEKARRELNEAFNILTDPKLKEVYDRELSVQEYVGDLERDRLARIRLSEIYVKSILGEDFDPDFSEMGTQSKLNFKKLEEKGKRPYSWKAILYEKVEELFVGKSKHPETPEIDSTIYAFRYGTMEFSYLFREDGQPSYTDGLSEIIGVTKIDKNGRERTAFVIAPLTDSGEIKNVTQQEYENLLEGNQNPIIVETPEEVSIRETRERYLKRMSQKYPKPPKHDKKRQERYARHLKRFIIEDELDDAQRGEIARIEEERGISEQRRIVSQSPKIIDLYEAVRQMHMRSEHPEPDDIRHVFLSRTIKQQVLPEDRDFFASVYLSDYLIENAVSNNAGYLGSFDKSGGKRAVSFGNPMEKQRIEACFYASTHPGEVTKLGSQTGIFSHKVGAHNTDALFSILKNAQKELVKKAKAKKYDNLDQVDL